MAGASIDLMLEFLRNRDDDEMIAHGKRFIETARGFAKLLKDSPTRGRRHERTSLQSRSFFRTARRAD